ncbi:MAG: glyoxalase/bleomycin resistance/dioxygenase family protein [Leptolyngbyaceae cyanobacterium CSU_1_4]|nr:glyoxalase/bleomycin resistance/dioxygenase family protein [Leptolyngbyaceae cyanobacterium CSU_1_4]
MNAWMLNTVRLFVTDIERAKQFYCDLLEMPLKADGSDNGFLLFDLGSVSLVVEKISEGSEAELVGRFAGLSFSVEDVHKVYGDLATRGVEFMGEPQVQPWGGTTVSLLDPDQNGLSLVSGLA